MMSLEFFIDNPAALWPWGDSYSNTNEYLEYFQGGKGGLHVTIVKKFWEP